MKRFVISLLVLSIAFMGVSIAAAQEPGAPPSQRADFPRVDRLQIVVDAVSEATGLDRAEILRMAVEDDMTLAEIITANGGNVDEVQATIVAALTEQINQQLTDLDQTVTDFLNNPVPQMREGGRGNRGPDIIQNVLEAIADGSDLDIAAVREQAASGATLAEIAETAGLDPDAIIETVKATATERLNQAVTDGSLTQEEADERLANLDELLNNLMNNPLPNRPFDGDRIGDGVMLAAGEVTKAIQDALNLEPGALREQVTEGQTLADFISANGGDVDAIKAAAAEAITAKLDEALSNERINQETYDNAIANLDTTIDEILNHDFAHRPPFRDDLHPQRDGSQAQ